MAGDLAALPIKTMKPYYQDELTTIYHGDSLELLNDISADVVITDPVWPNCPPGLLRGAEDPPALFYCAMHMLKSEVKRLVIVMRCDSDPRFLNGIPSRFKFCRVQTLPYAVPGHMGRILGGLELAYGYGQPIHSRPGQRVIPGNGPIAQPRKPIHKVNHPCARNLNHFLFLIRWWAMPGETVLDPFAGSGVTLAAAKKAGIKSIGIEIEEKFCEIAAERLRQSVLAFD